jgi:hypothetical protein
METPIEIPMVSRTKVPSENKRKNVQTERLSIRFTYARCNRFRLVKRITLYSNGFNPR